MFDKVYKLYQNIILVYLYKITKKQKKYFLYQVYTDVIAVIVFSLLKDGNNLLPAAQTNRKGMMKIEQSKSEK